MRTDESPLVIQRVSVAINLSARWQTLKKEGYFRKTNSSAYRDEFVFGKSKQCRGKPDVFRGIVLSF